MHFEWDRKTGIMKALDLEMKVTCIVRNELNQRRSTAERPVYSEKENGDPGVPYMPRRFPVGKWNITGVYDRDTDEMRPHFFATDAHQPVDEWTVVGNHYGEKTGKQVEDYGYGFHCSTFSTTLGCGKILDPKDERLLVAAIQAALDRHEPVTVSVV
jgi:hypothetical protein